MVSSVLGTIKMPILIGFFFAELSEFNWCNLYEVGNKSKSKLF